MTHVLTTTDADTFPDGGKLHRVAILSHQFWPQWYRGMTDADRRYPPQPDAGVLRDLAQQVDGQLLCINIEAWDVDLRRTDRDRVREGQKRLMYVCDRMHQANPGLRLGIYGLMPLRDYWSPLQYRRAVEKVDTWHVNNFERFKDMMEAWQTANGRMRMSRDSETGRFDARGLADCVDVLMPSLYIFYRRPVEEIDIEKQNIRFYFEENIREARRFQKPIYPFLWDLYHPSGIPGTADDRRVSAEIWRHKLDTLHRLKVDGAIHWSWSGFYTDRQPPHVAPAIVHESLRFATEMMEAD